MLLFALKIVTGDAIEFLAALRGVLRFSLVRQGVLAVGL
jgi:hypothetical protein